MALSVVVFPVPGPPVNTNIPLFIASLTASICFWSKLIPSLLSTNFSSIGDIGIKGILLSTIAFTFAAIYSSAAAYSLIKI